MGDEGTADDRPALSREAIARVAADLNTRHARLALVGTPADVEAIYGALPLASLRVLRVALTLDRDAPTAPAATRRFCEARLAAIDRALDARRRAAAEVKRP